MKDKIDLMEEDVAKLKEVMKKEFQEMYMQGYAAGTVSTCGILYKTFHLVGLEKTNILFTILKDLAAKNGCENLEQYSEMLGGK